MSYLYTSSRQAASTQSGLSTQILIQVDGQGVGAVQSMRVQQQRPMTRVTEVGTDGVIELVPNGASTVSLSVSRMVFDKKRITEAFQRGFLNIHAQRIPFDIVVYDFTDAKSNTQPNENPATLDVLEAFDAATDAEGVITTVFENCWFGGMTTNYTSSDYLISEDATIEVEFVHSFRDGNEGTPASRIPFDPDLHDALERLADVGRRGSLDARGLGRINDTFANLDNP